MSFHVFQLCGILATQGVIWGDPAGELVGSFCGRLEFNVYGFGETNRKTVEGTLAVWLATFVSSLCVVSAAEDVLSFSGYAMFFMSTIAKFMEIASPRGTNSFFLARLLIPIRRK